jgi:hypothetical protein
MQYDEAMLQTLLLQSPEQQSEGFVQAFPAVVQTGVTVPPSGVDPIGAHWFPTQVSVQQVLPAVGQVAPIVKHCVWPQVPLTQEPLQQSVDTPHLSPGFPHTAGEETHWLPRQR